MLNLEIKPHVFKFLDTLQAKQYRQVVQKTFGLMQKVRPHDSILLGNDLYRTDIGEYRIVYEFDERTVSILAVGKRNDDAIYKQVKRMH